MTDRVELRESGEIVLVAPAEFLERVRHAEVPLDAQVHYPPWTGEPWRHLLEIPALQEALDLPAPRFSANLLRRGTPWLTIALVVSLLAAAGAQLLWLGADAEGATALRRLALGWQPTIAAGAWWSPWTSQFVHASLLHLIGNLAVIGYCSFRCERALGASGLAMVLAGSVVGGSALLLALSPVACIGSSVLGFGLWGAQFAVGWRYEGWIPARWRGNYGFGTFVLTIPLFVESATSPQVSLLGHLGGWLGGVAVAASLFPPTAVPRATETAAHRRTFALAGLVAAAPMIAAAAASWVVAQGG